MNNNEFVLAGDGWVQVTPCGEFPHAGAGVVQVIDCAACDRIAAEFNVRKADANFPGVLVDFDHFSLDTEKSSEAAGWISDLESRDTGLWARVRWSDAGLSAVRGGRFRLMSPVFPPPSQCEDLGGSRIRPAKLVSVALTNEPNIRGGRPLANRRKEEGGRMKDEGTLNAQRSTFNSQRREGEAPCGATANSANDANGRTENRWSDVARAASLAVRQAKAEARRKAEGGRMKEEGETGDVSRGGAEAQRLDAARAAVMRELAKRRVKG